VWQKLDHPNILPFFGVDADQYPQAMALISPWMQGGAALPLLQNMGAQDTRREQLVRMPPLHFTL
jgi:hypothetical protein